MCFRLLLLVYGYGLRGKRSGKVARHLVEDLGLTHEVEEATACKGTCDVQRVDHGFGAFHLEVQIEAVTLVGLVDDEVDGLEVGFFFCGGAVGVAGLVVDGHRNCNGVDFLTRGDVHADIVDGEGHVGDGFVVHGKDGEVETSEIVADILLGIVDGFRVGLGCRIDGFLLAGCHHCKDAAQCDDECFFHFFVFLIVSY